MPGSSMSRRHAREVPDERQDPDPLGAAGDRQHHPEAAHRCPAVRDGGRGRSGQQDRRASPVVRERQWHRAGARQLRGAPRGPRRRCRLHQPAQLAAPRMDAGIAGGRQARPVREALHAPPGRGGRGVRCRGCRRPGARGGVHVAPHAPGAQAAGAAAAYRPGADHPVHVQLCHLGGDRRPCRGPPRRRLPDGCRLLLRQRSTPRRRRAGAGDRGADARRQRRGAPDVGSDALPGRRHGELHLRLRLRDP